MTDTIETTSTEMTTDIVEAGQAALKRIHKQGKKLIDDWVAVGMALAVGDAIKGNLKRKKWLADNFPDLSGQKHASTRRAAVWLAGLDAVVLQGLKNDGKLNHPVAIKQAYDKSTKEEAEGEKKTGFLSRYSKDGKVDPVLMADFFAALDEGPEKAADRLSGMPRPKLETMQAALAIALNRQDAAPMAAAA